MLSTCLLDFTVKSWVVRSIKEDPLKEWFSLIKIIFSSLTLCAHKVLYRSFVEEKKIGVRIGQVIGVLFSLP